MIGIYKITSPTNRVYIGQSIDINNRFLEYKRFKCKKQPRLYNSLIKHGTETHLFEIIEECKVEMLNERERYWQDYYDVLSKKGMNCILTNTYNLSGKKSYETICKYTLSRFGRMPLPKREKFRFDTFGRNNPFYGKKHSEESKLKISKAKKGVIVPKGVNHFNYGRKRNNEFKKKISDRHKGELNYWYGKQLPKETRVKISNAKKGKQLLGDNPNAKKVIDNSNGVIFSCLKELSTFTKIDYDILRYRVKDVRYRYNYLKGQG